MSPSRKWNILQRTRCEVRITLAFVVLVVVVTSQASRDGNESVAQDRGVVNIILIGATGDLAKKYLWQGFFNLVQEESGQAFQLYAGARTVQEHGEREIRAILEHNVSCSKLPSHSREAGDQCGEAKAVFRESVPYYQLKNREDYTKLCRDIQHKMEAMGLREVGRLVYLSVPPFAYAGIASYIDKECRPWPGAWLRVAVEKPFGRDSASAKQLSRELKEHLQEQEIYRIDHYLGKTGVQSILPFRAVNRKTYSALWNRESIDRVEIVMKEAVGVKGRISFYDKYGVIRDVMQNHLTEILSLVAMEIPSKLSNIHDFQREKLALLSQVGHLTSRQAVIGQYDGYADEWRSELGKGNYETPSVPTFAAVLLSISSPRWSGVPFLMVSGKKLDQKQTYVRILFKNTDFCPITPIPEDGDHACKPKQIIFFVGSSKLPTVAISKSLPKPTIPDGWTVPDLEVDTKILGSPVEEFLVYRAEPEKDAYSALIKDCYRGNRDRFVGTSELTASWDIWTPLLEDLLDSAPRTYPGDAATGRWLDLALTDDGELGFRYRVDSEWDTENSQLLGMQSMSGITERFRSDPLFTGSAKETVGFLARQLLASAQAAIDERGTFHVAFPGGKTPELLLMHLFLRLRHGFPWRHTHIWFVDERCVAHTSTDSNFQLLYSKLLKYLPVPYTSIHPMPVQLPRGLCQTEDNGVQIYAAAMQRLLPDSRLDFVILGVGQDGHVASLFPHQGTLHEDKLLVSLADAPKGSRVSKRMTLTYKVLNSARAVAILILGEKKHALVEMLKQEHLVDKQKLPVLGVRLKQGNMTWFIDHDALLG